MKRRIFVCLLVTIFLGFLCGLLRVERVMAAQAVDPLGPSTGMNLEKWVIGTPQQRGVVDDIIASVNKQLWGARSQGSGTTDGGALGTMAGLVSTLYIKKPISSQQYFAYLGENLGLVQPAYAQGKGWKAMEPILGLWKLMRDTCYLFFIIIFATVGLSIMFRQKIDSQTVISIQNAIPGLIVSLILVTFSYAIAGLLIDLCELATGLIASVLTTGNFVDPGEIKNFLARFVNTSLWARGADPSKAVANIWTVLTGFLNNIGDIITGIQSVFSGIPIVGGFLSGPLGMGFMGIAIGLTIFQSVFKTFTSLLTAYLTIVFLTIFSPFIFLVAATGKSDAVGTWFKDMLSNVLVFPMTFMVIMIGAIIVNPTGFPWDNGAGGAHVINPGMITGDFLWRPVPLGIFWKQVCPVGLPCTYSIDSSFINALLGLAIILALPKVPELAKSIVEGKGGGVAGLAAGGELTEGLRGSLKSVPIVGSIFG